MSEISEDEFKYSEFFISQLKTKFEHQLQALTQENESLRSSLQTQDSRFKKAEERRFKQTNDSEFQNETLLTRLRAYETENNNLASLLDQKTDEVIELKTDIRNYKAKFRKSAIKLKNSKEKTRVLEKHNLVKERKLKSLRDSLAKQRNNMSRIRRQFGAFKEKTLETLSDN